jgi:FTR1 family protein
MLPTFVIGLREGVEAALIVGIVAAFLRQEGRQDALRWVWLGVGLALAICAAVGISLQIVNDDLPQRQQEMLETVVGLAAVVIVTAMIFWMRRNARGMAGELRENTRAALAKGSVGALIGMAFFAVLREGMETAVFLLAAFQSATNPATAGFGAVLGVLVAVVIGIGIYRGGLKINLARFFRLTGFVLVLVAAGLVASSLHTAHEAGWINFGQAQALDLTWLVVPGTWTASLLTGMLGLQPQPTVIELVGYLVFLIPMALFVLWPQRPRALARKVATQSAATASLLLALMFFVAGCGSSASSSDSGSGAQGAKTVSVKLTDAGCEPAQLKLDAGPTTFQVANAGTSKVSEFEILDGDRILGEKENLVAGLSGKFDLNLKPGSYTISCPGGTSSATGPLEVGGATVANDNSRLKSATTSYRSYVESQADELVTRTEKFVAAIKSGDVAQAKSLFASTRAPYERIEPVAESFGGLDPAIDARVNDVAKGDPWTGFHRIEQALWVKGSTQGMDKVADKLLADVKQLRAKVEGLEYQPEELSNGANGLLDEVSASKITGEEDRYSHTDLSDFEANVDGSQTTFGLLAPALRERDKALATRISQRFDAVNSALDSLKRDGGFPSYDTVGTAQRRQLSQLVDALAEPLSQVAATLQG